MAASNQSVTTRVTPLSSAIACEGLHRIVRSRIPGRFVLPAGVGDSTPLMSIARSTCDRRFLFQYRIVHDRTIDTCISLTEIDALRTLPRVFKNLGGTSAEELTVKMTERRVNSRKGVSALQLWVQSQGGFTLEATCGFLCSRHSWYLIPPCFW